MENIGISLTGMSERSDSKVVRHLFTTATGAGVMVFSTATGAGVMVFSTATGAGR